MLNWCLFSKSELELLLGTDFDKGISSQTALLRSGGNDVASLYVKEFFYPFTTFVKNLGAAICDFPNLILVVSLILSEIFSQQSPTALNIVIGFLFAVSAIRTGVSVYLKFTDADRTDEESYRVIRDGKIKNAKAKSLVRGDIVLLSKGDIVPVTLRLTESENLTVIEKTDGKRVRSTVKDAEFFPMSSKNINAKNQKNMLFTGSAVCSGKAVAVVIDEKMTLAVAKKILKLSEELWANYETDTSFTNSRVLREREKDAETEILPGAEKIIFILRLCAICVGAVVMVFNLLGKAYLTDAYLAGAVIMACSPRAIYEMCTDVVFAIGKIRLSRQGVKIKNSECAKTLALSESVILSSGAAYNVEKMIPHALYIGRNIELSKAQEEPVKRVLKLLLYCENLRFRTDKSGKKTIAGDAEGKSLLETMVSMGVVRKGTEGRYILGKKDFYNVNGELFATLCMYEKEKTLIVKGGTEVILAKCSHYDFGDGTEVLDAQMRERIAENSKAYENTESCKVVALCHKRCSNVRRSDFSKGLIFDGFLVLRTKVSYSGAKYAELLRKNGVTPIIFSGTASDMTLYDARKIGVLNENDNYITSKTFSGLDKSRYSEELKSYTLYMGLTPQQKQAVVNIKKGSEGTVALVTEKSQDAFDMPGADVVISFGNGITKALGRISDIYSKDSGIRALYRTVCSCRNMLRSAALSLGYLVFSQSAIMLFSLFSALAAFFTGGVVARDIAHLCGVVFACDLLIAFLVATVKTPHSIISDKPKSFEKYYSLGRILPQALLAGGLSAGFAFITYLAASVISSSFEEGSFCAFLTLFLSKAFVSLFCVMKTGTKKAPAPFPAVALMLMLVFFAVTLAMSGYTRILGNRLLVAIVLISAILPALFTLAYQKFDAKK